MLDIKTMIDQINSSVIPEFPAEFQRAQLTETISDKLSVLAMAAGIEQAKLFGDGAAFIKEAYREILDLFRYLNSLDYSKFSEENQKKLALLHREVFASNNAMMVYVLTSQKLGVLIQENLKK